MTRDVELFKNYIAIVLNTQLTDVPHLVDDLAQVLAEKLAPEVCVCWDGNYNSIEGQRADCPVHGVVLAYNELMRVKEDTDRINRAAQAALEGQLADVQRESVQINAENIRLGEKLEEALRTIFEAGGQHAERMIKMSAAMREQEAEIESVKRERRNLKVKLDGVYSDIRALLDGVE